MQKHRVSRVQQVPTIIWNMEIHNERSNPATPIGGVRKTHSPFQRGVTIVSNQGQPFHFIRKEVRRCTRV
nr:hypothetical protein [uncultured bacterium]